MQHDSVRSMVKSFGMAARLWQAMRLPASFLQGLGSPRSVLVLRLIEGDRLRSRLGPALFERLMDNVTLHLTIELGLNPMPRGPGATEIAGALSPRSEVSLPQQVALLGRICAEDVDLGGVRVAAKSDGVIIRSLTETDMARLADFGRDALSSAPAVEDARIRVLDYAVTAQAPGPPSVPARAAQAQVQFQPQLCCDTGRLVALRVTALTEDPRGTPVTFEEADKLPAERIAGFIHATLRQALAALRGWDRRGLAIPFLSLHLPDGVLADRSLVEGILWELDRLDLAPDRLEIEFSEPAGSEREPLPVRENLERLSGAGCRIAIGDFGTGRARLADLRGFGVKRVRVGRAFVAGCGHDGDQQRMILAILALAENLRLELLADGVLTTEERGFLAQIGFNAVQGSAVAPPMPAERIEEFVSGHMADLSQGLRLGGIG